MFIIHEISEGVSREDISFRDVLREDILGHDVSEGKIYS